MSSHGMSATGTPVPTAGTDTGESDHLQRNLQNRHVQLIAIGGAIGTGLFMGSGKTIATAGPSILLVYIIIGAVLFLFMRAMGELLLSDSRYHTFADIARDLIGPWAGVRHRLDVLDVLGRHRRRRRDRHHRIRQILVATHARVDPDCHHVSPAVLPERDDRESVR